MIGPDDPAVIMYPMTIHLTAQQRLAVADGDPVRLPAPECGQEVVLLRADLFDRLQGVLRDEREQ